MDDATRYVPRICPRVLEAGWQLHIHVNGDAALDLVLETVDACMTSHPRADHRTVIVHFANSTEEQIDRIARLGAIVSANSYSRRVRR